MLITPFPSTWRGVNCSSPSRNSPCPVVWAVVRRQRCGAPLKTNSSCPWVPSAWQDLVILVGAFSLWLTETFKWILYIEKERKSQHFLGNMHCSLACPGTGLKGTAVLSEFVCSAVGFLRGNFPLALKLPTCLTACFPQYYGAVLCDSPCALSALAECVMPGWRFPVFLALHWKKIWVWWELLGIFSCSTGRAGAELRNCLYWWGQKKSSGK